MESVPSMAFAPLASALVGALLNFIAPLGLPPLPPDAVIERAAPDKCLVYLSWCGMATPDPKSENQTEQFLAEPEVRKFLQAIDAQLTDVVKQGGPAELRDARESVSQVARLLLTRPTAIYLEAVSFGPAGPEISGGLAVNAGDDRPALEAALAKLIAMAPPLGSDAQDADIGGVKCHQIPSPPGAPEIWWGSKGKYLMLGVGKKSIDGLIARMSDKSRTAPAWLTATREKMKIDRVSQIMYVDVQNMVGALGGPPTDPQQRIAWRALGGDTIRTISAVTGLNRGGMVSRALVDCGGKPQGVWSMLGEKPLAAADMKTTPANSPSALALRLSLAELYDSALDIASPEDPAGKEQMRDQVDGIQAGIGINVRDNLLAHLGDTICVYGSAGESGNPLGGALTISVRDQGKLAKTEKSLLNVVKGFLTQPGAPKLGEENVGGQTIRHVEIKESPVTPSWTITRDELVFGLSPQAVKEHLGRSAGAKSLADSAMVGAVLKRPTGPSMIAYTDASGTFDTMYALAQGALPMANEQLKAEGAPFSIPPLPPAAVVKSHLRPTVTLITRTKDGVMIERSQSIPLVGDLVSAGPAVVAIVLPAIQSARAAARRSASLNNMKQIGLALLNHHDAKKRFPAAAITGKDGKPLLSWRVAILPYLGEYVAEEPMLYRKFHLDEPWDSEHNFKLIQFMPGVYKSPGIDLPPGKTVYLGLTGGGAFFPPDKGRNIRDITDGLSFTLAVVEARPDRAVIWTKPDDLPADEKALDAVRGARPEGFQSLFADCRVEVLPYKIDPNVFKALLTVDGGEAVNPILLDSKP